MSVKISAASYAPRVDCAIPPEQKCTISGWTSSKLANQEKNLVDQIKIQLVCSDNCFQVRTLLSETDQHACGWPAAAATHSHFVLAADRLVQALHTHVCTCERRESVQRQQAARLKIGEGREWEKDLSLSFSYGPNIAEYSAAPAVDVNTAVSGCALTVAIAVIEPFARAS